MMNELPVPIFMAIGLHTPYMLSSYERLSSFFGPFGVQQVSQILLLI